MTLPFVVQVVGIVGLVSYLSYRSGQEAIADLAHQLTNTVEHQVSHELDRQLAAAHEANQHNIAAIEAGVISLQNLDQLHRYLILQHLQTEDLTTLLLGTPQGDLRVSHRVDARDYGATAQLRPGELPFEAAISTAARPNINRVYRINAAGDLGRPLGVIENLDVRDRPWYRRAVTTGRPGWSGPYQLGASTLLTLNASAPFYDASDRLLGVFAVNISLNQLSDWLRRLEIGQTGEIFIMERNGLLIANSAPEPSYTVIGQTNVDGMMSPGTLKFRRHTPDDLSDPAIHESYRFLKSKFNSLEAVQSPQALEFQVGSDRYFLNVAPYRDAYGLDWLIVTVVPQSDFMSAIYANISRTIALSGLALLGSIGLGIWTSRRIARSLLRMSQAIQAVAEGDLEIPLPDSRVVEVDALGMSFRQMVQALRQVNQLHQRYEHELERQVSEKTAALTQAQRIAQVGSWEFDIATSESRWSAAQFCILRRDPAAGVPSYDQIWELLPSSDRPRMQAAVEAAIAHGTPYEIEHQMIRGDGSRCFVISRGEPVYDSHGQLTKLVGTIADITDRKQTELGLQESEARQRAILSAIPDLMYITDANGRILDHVTSNPWVDLFKEDAEWCGKTIYDVGSPEVVRRKVEAIEQARLTGQVQTYEQRVEIEGRSQYEEVQCVPMEGDRVLFVFHDITPRKQLELALKVSEANLNDILNSATAAITSMRKLADHTWVTDYRSAGYEQIFGYTNTELNAAPELWRSRVIPEDRDRVISRTTDIENVPVRGQFEYRFYHKDGSLRWISATYAVRCDPVGHCAVITIIETDITQLKQTEAQLRQSEATNRAVLLAIPDLLLRIGRDGTCYDFLPPTDAKAGTFLPVQRHLSEVLPPDLLAYQLQRIEQALLTGERQVWEHQIVKYGQLCDEEVRLVPCGVDECLVIVRDITERKRSDLALQQAKQQLEDRLEDLKQRNQEMALLSDLNDFLQGCLTVENAYSAIATWIAPLFPGCAGGIFRIEAATHTVNPVALWGNALPAAPQFSPDDCWTLLQDGGAIADSACAWHGSTQTRTAMTRQSGAEAAIAMTLCIPMIAQGETLGLFYLNADTVAALPEPKQQLARTVAEQMALAIANLHLRDTLRQQSIRDPLTGLYNRRYLEESLSQEIARAQRQRHTIGVIMLDIDHFKQVNDTYGHDIGDYVLQTVSTLLKGNVRGSDVICRYGGEELTLILPESSLSEASKRAEEIRLAIAQLALNHQGRSLRSLTVSLGVACFPQHGTTGAEVLQAADAALYRAKASGRNRVIVAT
ncbi:MAG TPA: diguanylate cyclase [Chroococcidiopsis sp.]